MTDETKDADTSDIVPVFHDEAMLMSWGESDTQGPWIKLRLPSSEALAPFRGMTKTKGGKAGQRLACSMVEIGDDELPVKQEPEKPKGGSLAKSAAQMCAVPEFQNFLREKHVEEWAIPDCLTVEEQTATVVRIICGVKSRSELDHNQQAARYFHELMRHYRAWREHETNNQR